MICVRLADGEEVWIWAHNVSKVSPNESGGSIIYMAVGHCGYVVKMRPIDVVLALQSTDPGKVIF